MVKVLLFNPRSASAKYRIPNSILNIAASIENIFEWVIVDGNRETDPYEKIAGYLAGGSIKYIGFTVMPGPQLKQAIPFSKRIKKDFPHTTMIWGGYFPSNQYPVVIKSGYVDFVINGPGDHAFPNLINALENHSPLEGIKNLIYQSNGQIVKAAKEDLIEQETLAPLPYDRLNSFYPVGKYLGKTYLGNKTLAYHSASVARLPVLFAPLYQFMKPDGRPNLRLPCTGMSNTSKRAGVPTPLNSTTIIFSFRKNGRLNSQSSSGRKI